MTYNGEHQLCGEIRLLVTQYQAVWVEHKGWWFRQQVKGVYQIILGDNLYAELQIRSIGIYMYNKEYN